MEFTKNTTQQPPEVIEEVKPFDLAETTHAVALQVEKSPNVDRIVNQLDLNHPQTIMEFGKQSTEEIASFADRILSTMETSKVEDSGEMLQQLEKIMEKFDIKDFEEQKPSMMQKLFKRAKNSIDALFKKYHTMGDEVDKVYVCLKGYESELYQSNGYLDEQFDKNKLCYKQLEEFIYAGEWAINEINTNLQPQLERQLKETNDPEVQMDLNNLLQSKDLLEQRVHDLKLTENIALQTMPTIKSIQYGNYQLIQKINSAFIITLPIFKQCLTQAIMLKRQAVQAKAMQALDAKTNELILRNAQNTAMQTKLTAKMASSGSVQYETLEKAWNTIMGGIEESKQIKTEMKQKQAEDSVKLKQLKQEILSHV